MSGIVFGIGPGAQDRCEVMINKLYREGMKKSILSISNDWACGRLWLGHLSYEQGPVTVGELTVLIDGEIYGDNGPEENPAAILADLYRSNKLDTVIPKLDGSFAAAIFNPQKNRFVFFNDRLGTRTFFICEYGGSIIASSRPLFLLQDPSLPRRVSRQSLFEILSFRRICSSRTLYADIEIMPGGSLWRYESRKLSRQKIWKLNWKSPDFTLAEAPERFTGHLIQAARRRFGDKERSGILLSGGIDSRLVLAAAKAAQKPVSCLTLGPYENREVMVARAVAKAADVPFKYIPNPSEELEETFDEAAIATEGIYVAPFNFFRRFPEIIEENDVLFSGHALDITFRGVYLPHRVLRIAGGSAKVPLLGAMRNDDIPAEIVRIWHGSTPLSSLQKILPSDLHGELEERRRQATSYAVSQAEIDDPYNAIDAFVFQTQLLHYAWNDFAAMESVIKHRTLCFDKELFDFYLSFPPAWRVYGEVPRRALKNLNMSLANEWDANTGHPLRWNGWAHIVAMMTRSALRRAGLQSKIKLPTPMATPGSWSNLDQLLRLNPGFQRRLQDLSQDESLLGTGIFTVESIRAVVEEHLSGAAYHGKLLHTLLSLSAWFRTNPYSGVS